MLLWTKVLQELCMKKPFLNMEDYHIVFLEYLDQKQSTVLFFFQCQLIIFISLQQNEGWPVATDIKRSKKNKRDKEEWTAHQSTNSHYGAYSWKYLFKTYYRHSSLPHCKSWISLLHLRHSFPMTKVAAPHYATATDCKRQQDIKHITQEKIQTLDFICQGIC